MSKLRSIMILSVIGLMTVSISACSFFGPKKNTKPIKEIISNAKTVFAENLKESIRDDLGKYEENINQTLKKTSGEGDVTGSFSLDVAEKGKINIEFKETFSADSSQTEKLSSKSSILDMISSFKTVMTEEIVITTTGMPDVKDQSMKLVLDVYAENGVLNVKLKDVQAPEDLPGLPTKAEIEAFVSLYKNKWFRINVGEIAEKNAFVMAFLSQKLYELDTEKLNKLITLYIDDVFSKNTWFEVDESSKTATKKGDEYKLLITKDLAANLVEKHYDFVINNLELIDSIFDLRGIKNPMAKLIPGLEPSSLDKIRDDFMAEKLATISSFATQPYNDVTLKLIAAGDAVFGLNYGGEFSEADSKGDYNIGIEMYDGQHDVTNMSLNGDLKVSPNNGKGGITARLKMLAKKANTEITADVEMSAPDLNSTKEEAMSNLNADFKINIDDESQTVDSLALNFNFETENIMPGVNGFEGNLKYRGGEDADIKANIQSDPKNSFNVSLDANLGRRKGGGDLKMNMDITELKAKWGALGSINYSFNAGPVSIAAPEGLENIEDLTGLILNQLNTYFSGPTLSNGGLDLPADADTFGSEFETDGFELTEEELESLRNPEGFEELINE